MDTLCLMDWTVKNAEIYFHGNKNKIIKGKFDLIEKVEIDLTTGKMLINTFADRMAYIQICYVL